MCGCQGNKSFTPPDVTLPHDEYVMVRYIGHRGGINPYPGANGGYRFGTQRRDGIVTTEDAKRLLAFAEGGKPAFELVDEPAKTEGPKGGEQPPTDPVVNAPPPVKPPPVQRTTAPKPATKAVGKHKPGARGK